MPGSRQFILKRYPTQGWSGLVLFKRKTRVLFVCTENVCRSPLAEGLLRHHLRKAGMGASVKVGSAGTHASMRGACPDPRAEKLAAAAGVKLGRIRARRVSPDDVMHSDYIFAMDHSHLAELMDIAPPGHEDKISLLLSHQPGSGQDDVPDPHYGSMENFREVYRLIEEAVLNLLPLFDTTKSDGY